MRARSGLLQNLGFLTAGQVASQLLNLGVLVFLAERLGPRDFGIVQIGVTVMAYGLIIAEWGLMSLGVRDIARLDSREAVRHYAGELTTLLTIQALVILLVGWILLPRLPLGSQDLWVLRIYLLAVIPQIFHYAWVATGLERMAWVGGTRVLLSLLYAAFLIAALAGRDGLSGSIARRWVPVCYVAAFAISNLVLMLPLRRWLGAWIIPRIPDRATWWRHWRQTAPIGGGLLVLRVLLNIDLLLLGLLADPAIAGQYAAASRIAFLLVVAIEVLWGALLPRLSRLAARSPRAFSAELSRLLALALAGVLPVALGGILLGPALMGELLDSDYGLSGPVLRILSASYALLAIGTFLGRALIAEDRQDEHFRPIAVGALVALVTAAWAIPRWGAPGAAWAMLLAHGLLALWLLYLHRRSLGFRPLRDALALLPALGALAGAGLLFEGVGFPLRLAAAAGAYAVLAFWPVRRWLTAAPDTPNH